MQRHQIYTQYGCAAVLVALNLVVFNMLVSGRPLFRLDLTEDREYSLSPVTRELVRDLDEDLYLYGYFSEKTHPKLAPLVPEIEDLAREYGVLSGGKIHVVFTDPRTDDRIAEEAKQRYGVNPVPIMVPGKYENAVINTYFHIVIAYGDQYVRYEPRDLFEVRMEEWEPIVTVGNLEYTLTKGIKKVLYGFQSVEAVLAGLDREAELLAWVSKEQELPESLRQVPEFLRAVGEEMAEQSGGKLRFELRDPPTDPRQQEELFRRYQVRPFSLGFFEARSFYCSAVLRIGDTIAPVYLAEGEDVSEASIRESVRSTLARAVPGFLRTVGLVSPEPEMPNPMMQQPPRRDFQYLREVLGNDYSVKDVTLDRGVDADVEVLFVLKPETLSEDAVFHLDQYLMRGGRVILAVDRFEADPDAMRMGQIAVREIENGPLLAWLENLGVKVENTMVEDDRNAPFIIPHRQRMGAIEIETLHEVPYPWFVAATGEGLASDHPAVSRLEGLTFYWASPVRVDEEKAAGRSVTPLVSSSRTSWASANTNVMPPDAVLDAKDPVRHWYPIPEATEPQPLAVAVVGMFPSYFAEHAPPGETAPAEEKASEDEAGETETETAPNEEKNEEKKDEEPKKAFLDESPETRLVILGDAEIFSEQAARVTGRTQEEFDGNLLFAQNLVDWSLLDNDMIRIRSRGATARPLDTERFSPARAEILSYAIPCGIVILLGILRFVGRRTRKPISLASAD